MNVDRPKSQKLIKASLFCISLVVGLILNNFVWVTSVSDNKVDSHHFLDSSLQSSPKHNFDMSKQPQSFTAWSEAARLKDDSISKMQGGTIVNDMAYSVVGRGNESYIAQFNLRTGASQLLAGNLGKLTNDSADSETVSPIGHANDLVGLRLPNGLVTFLTPRMYNETVVQLNLKDGKVSRGKQTTLMFKNKPIKASGMEIIEQKNNMVTLLVKANSIYGTVTFDITNLPKHLNLKKVAKIPSADHTQHDREKVVSAHPPLELINSYKAKHSGKSDVEINQMIGNDIAKDYSLNQNITFANGYLYVTSDKLKDRDNGAIILEYQLPKDQRKEPQTTGRYAYINDKKLNLFEVEAAAINSNGKIYAIAHGYSEQAGSAKGKNRLTNVLDTKMTVPQMTNDTNE